MKYLSIPSGRLALFIMIALVVYLTPLGMVVFDLIHGSATLTFYDAIAGVWSLGAVHTFKVIAKLALL